MSNLILASTSPTRRRLLENAGIVFTAIKPGVDEEALVAADRWDVTVIAQRLAEAKSLALANVHPQATIIGADQTMSVENTLIERPRDISAAREMLLALRDKRHTLRSAVVCSRHGKIIFSHVEDAHLTMRNFSIGFLDEYMQTAGPDVIQSAGGYRLEDRGIQLFERIDGDYFTILGLPLLPLLSFLRQQGEVMT